MSRSKYKFKNIFKIFSKSDSLFLGIAIIFLLLSASIKYDNTEIISSQAYATTSITSSTADNTFVKTTVRSISSNSNNYYVPFTSNLTLPPRIVMVYNGIPHSGVLVSYKYRHGYTFGQLDIPAIKVTALLPSDVVNIKRDSFVQFIAKGNPPILPPSSISIDAYTSQGKAISVLNITKGTSSGFALNLNEGKYILLATATWLPGSEDVTGYSIFSYMVNVVA
jgi:hypothetical protein